MARPAKTTAKVKTESVGAISRPVVSAFSIGEPVSHAMFGDGDIIDVQDRTLTIAFQKFGVKHVLDGFVKQR